MKLFTPKNPNILKLAAIGAASLLLAVLVIVCDPLQMIIDSELTLRSSSLLYKLWQKPPLEVFLKVYVFNVTNLDAFRRGHDAKLRLAEVGPYVYQEFLEHHNVTFNANNTLTYQPRRTVKFVRDRSVGDPQLDQILVPNIPYMGVSSAASEFSIFAAIALSALTKRLDSKAMLVMSVHDYLWGYDDPLVTLAARFVPSIINFQRFGLLERVFDEGKNVVTMALPETGASAAEDTATPEARGYFIDNWNGRQGLAQWGYQENVNNTNCSVLRGAFDGTLFPRSIQKGDTFRVYRKAFCRALPIHYSHPGLFNGVEAYHFKLSANAFDSSLEDEKSACYCKSNKCLRRGLGSITPCYYNIPLAISFPHFLGADPSLLTPIDGLSPDQAKHETEIAIQPQLGIPMRVHSRFQINLLMGDVKCNSDMRRFQNLVLPIFWLDIGVDSLTPGLTLLLKLLFQFCPRLQLGLIVALFAASAALMGGAFLIGWTPLPWRRLKSTVGSNLLSNSTVLPLVRNAGTAKLRSPEEQKCSLLA